MDDNESNPVGRVPPPGAGSDLPTTDPVGRVHSRDERRAGSGDPAYNPAYNRLPRRLRRLHRVWPDRDGNISYLLTMCVDGRGRILDNQMIFDRLVAFLLDSPLRYRWFGRRFVIMPDHIHLIARMGADAVTLGRWVKALKAVVGGLQKREERPVRAPGLHASPVGRVPSHGDGPDLPPAGDAETRQLTRVKRAWRWQDGYHDHKFRTPESESRKWEYVCLNPVRYGLVDVPEKWPYGGEIFYDDEIRFVAGTPPLLETGFLIQEDESPGEAPGEGTRPTTW